LLTLCLVAACSSWHQETLSPSQLITSRQPDKVRVTIPGGRHVLVLNPRVSGDTLAGLDFRGDRKVVPVADIQTIETRRFSTGKLALGVAGLAVFTAIMASGCWSMNASCQ
jgi:hypothetical protein